MNTFKKIWIVAVVMVMICMLPVAAMALAENRFANCNIISGTAEWDEATRTLTLNNADIEGYFRITDGDFAIEMIGESTITCTSEIAVIGSAGHDITFCGEGTLTLRGPFETIASASGTLTFQSGIVNAFTESNSNKNKQVVTADEIIICEDAALNATTNSGYYAVYAGTSIRIDGTLIASTQKDGGAAVYTEGNGNDALTVNGADAATYSVRFYNDDGQYDGYCLFESESSSLPASSVEINLPEPPAEKEVAAPVSVPKTGDSTPVILLASLMLMSAAVLFARKKRTA